MYYLIYLSAAVHLPTESELIDILSVSRKNNYQQQITCMLLYGDGKFIQLLEGERANVQRAFEKIGNDARHKSITMISSGEIGKRYFPEWAMGFKSLDAASLSQLEAYLAPANSKALNEKADQLPVKLLRAFMRSSKITSENIKP